MFQNLKKFFLIVRHVSQVSLLFVTSLGIIKLEVYYFSYQESLGAKNYSITVLIIFYILWYSHNQDECNAISYFKIHQVVWAVQGNIENRHTYILLTVGKNTFSKIGQLMVVFFIACFWTFTALMLVTYKYFLYIRSLGKIVMYTHNKYKGELWCYQ